MYFEKLTKNLDGSSPAFAIKNLLLFCIFVQEGGDLQKATKVIMRDVPKGHRGGTSEASIKENLRRGAIDPLAKAFGVELYTVGGKGKYPPTQEARRLRMILEEYSYALESVVVDGQAMPDKLNIVCSAGGFVDWHWNHHLKEIRANLPGKTITITSMRTQDVVDTVKGSGFNLGVMDIKRVPKQHLGMESLTSFGYALFIPKTLEKGEKLTSTTRLTPKIIKDLPMAGLEGEGEFMKTLRQKSKKSGYELNFKHFYGGFPEILSALLPGRLAAVLPEHAGVGLNVAGYFRIEKKLPFLKGFKRQNAIVWNKRVANHQQWLPDAAEKLKKALKASLS